MSVSIKQDDTTIPKLEKLGELNYQYSTCECSHFIDSLKGRETFEAIRHTCTMKEVREKMCCKSNLSRHKPWIINRWRN